MDPAQLPRGACEVHDPFLRSRLTLCSCSGAIVQYLISKYGKGRFVIHDDEDKQLDDTFFQHFAEGEL